MLGSGQVPSGQPAAIVIATSSPSEADAPRKDTRARRGSVSPAYSNASRVVWGRSGATCDECNRIGIVESYAGPLEKQDVVSYLLFEQRLSVDQVVVEYGVSRDFAALMSQRFEISDHKRAVIAAQEYLKLSPRELMM